MVLLVIFMAAVEVHVQNPGMYALRILYHSHLTLGVLDDSETFSALEAYHRLDVSVAGLESYTVAY